MALLQRIFQTQVQFALNELLSRWQRFLVAPSPPEMFIRVSTSAQRPEGRSGVLVGHGASLARGEASKILSQNPNPNATPRVCLRCSGSKRTQPNIW